MKRLYLFFLMFLMQVNLYAQEIEWAKKISIPFWNPHGMLYDNSGNVYLYGSYYRNWNINDPGQVINDTVGSFIQKYSDEGELIFEKRWKLPFYIVKMIFDGDNAFYFTGCFAGSLNLNGVAFNSMGEYDGMVGKMDLNGNIYWVSTFGGGKSDFGMGISMYANSTNLLITGSVADSLFVNSQYKGSEPLPMFLGIFNLNGHNIKNKLVDFIPERIHSNRGIEITCDKNNEIFVLGDREGAHWYGDTIDGPLAGRYIIKFNENLDTLWSRYLIGPSCYNGWSNGNLVADSK
ncbi:MAG: hypothetical protein H0V01_10935 [Bacteroidetes bacterium]|nr:hypothetical protein [Bacteroidota bacterium]HET6243819.1 hypothetical protein [Bacteroidia bacterium]